MSNEQVSKQLPKDLGGWQCVESGPIKEGDIAVLYGKPLFYFTNLTFGTEASSYGYNAYRKIPVAKQGDCDDTGWKAKQEALRAEARLAGSGQSKALTHDDGKPPLAYLPWAGIDEVAMVQSYGQKKYGDFWNYRKGMEVGRNLSCAIRHIRAFMEGEDLDNESGRSHLAHAACRLLFTLQNLNDGTAIDDRYNPNK